MMKWCINPPKTTASHEERDRDLEEQVLTLKEDNKLDNAKNYFFEPIGTNVQGMPFEQEIYIGNQSKVVLSKLKETPVCLKIFKAEIANDKIQAEIDLQRLVFKNFPEQTIEVLRAFRQGKNCFLVTPLVNQTLRQYTTRKITSFKLAKVITVSMIMFLDQIQTVGFVHCGFNLDNMLLPSVSGWHLPDIAKALRLIDYSHAFIPEVQKPPFVSPSSSPEVLLQESGLIGLPTDVFDCGVAVYEMLTQKRLLTGESDSQKIAQLCSYLTLPEYGFFQDKCIYFVGKSNRKKFWEENGQKLLRLCINQNQEYPVVDILKLIDSKIDLTEQVGKLRNEKLNNDVISQLNQFFQGTLAWEPIARPTAKQLFESPFVQSIYKH